MSRSRPVLLILDDDLHDFQRISNCFSELNYDLVRLPDDDSTWEELAKDPYRYDVVLLDRQISSISGLDVLRRIKNEPKLEHLPVVIMTPSATAHQIAQGLSAGAFYYISKPYHAEVLRAVVTNALNANWDAQQQALYRLALDNSYGFSSMVIDEAGRIASWNDGARRMLHFNSEDVLGKSADFFLQFEGQAETYLNSLESAIHLGVYKKSAFCKRKDGSKFYAELTVTPIQDNARQVAGYVQSFYEIGERAQIEELIRHLAFQDSLTRLANRRLLLDRLTQALEFSKRTGCYGALLFLDLDSFKPLNDKHGHDMGDLLLVEVANRLKSIVRQSDTVARFGGDEFVVMIHELDVSKERSFDQAKNIAEKIRMLIAKPYFLAVRKNNSANKLVEYYCTASIGITLFGNDGRVLDDIMRCADSAMYRAKSSGKNQIYCDE